MLLNNHDQILHCFLSVVENLGHYVSRCFVLYWRELQRKNYIGANMICFVRAQFMTKVETIWTNEQQDKWQILTVILACNKDLFYIYKCIHIYVETPYLDQKKIRNWQLVIFCGPVVKFYNLQNQTVFLKCCLLSLSLNAPMLRFSLIQTVFLFCCIHSGNTF